MSRRPAPRSHFCRLALVAVFLCWGCASTPPPRPSGLAVGDYSYAKAYGQWLIEQEMSQNDIKGLSLALVDDQKTVWSKGFGFAKEAMKIPVDADTMFQAGSVSKLFTATALMQLVEQGKVELDHPLQEYLPDFSVQSRFPDTPPITLRQLLTHHSGLPSNRWAGWAYAGVPPEGYETDFLGLPGLLKDTYLSARPGDMFSYSNLGFTLLGAVVVRVSGEAFTSHMRTSVLAPMGMDSSAFGKPQGSGQKLSAGYSGGHEVDPRFTRDLPAGGLITTAADLAKFIKMVLGGGRSGEAQILRAETLAEMLRRQNEGVALDGDRQFGLGWGITPAQPKSTSFVRSVGHGGALPPFYAMLLVLPEEKLGIAVLTNSDGGEHVSGKVALEVLKRAWEAKTGSIFSDAEPPARTELPAEKLDTFAGIYASSVGLVEIARSGASLEARMPGRTLNLIPCVDGSFETEYRLLGIAVSGDALKQQRFVFREVNGRRIFDIVVGSSILAKGERIKGSALGEVWKKRLGRYEVTNPGSFPWIKMVNLVYDERTKLLLVDLFEQTARSLAPLRAENDSEAIVLGFGPIAGETLQFKNVNGEDRLMYSGYELRRAH